MPDAVRVRQGDIVGRYVVLTRVGSGAMGVVYAAYDPELDRKVALKLLLPREGSDVESRGRLQREARALAKLAHPNVVAVHDVGELGDRVYIAMEYVEGQTVGEWLSAAKRSWKEVLAVFLQAAHGLAAAHEEGMLHRDVKPDNLMVDQARRVRVMDFGLVRSDPTRDSEAAAHGLDGGANIDGQGMTTQAGALLGTPAYMAPEQFEGGALDARTDQFGLCTAFWEALYGERPFEGDDLFSLCDAVTRGKRRAPPASSGVPTWLRHVVERGLATRPDDRWPSMVALIAALSRRPARIRGAWFAGGALLAIGGAFWAGSRRPAPALCSGAPAALAEVWDDGRRELVRERMLGTGLPYVAGVWERAATRLDEWTGAWIAAHEEACRATHQRGEQSESVMDLRMACLHRGRTQLDAVAGVLERADAEVIDNFDRVLSTLPHLDSCSDIDALQAGVEPPRPEDEATVADARAQLAAATSELAAGHHATAMKYVTSAARIAEGLDYGPVRAELAFTRGRTLSAMGRYDDADVELRRALTQAIEDGAWLGVQAAASELVFVMGKGQENHDAALRYRELGEAAAGDDSARRARVISNYAISLESQGMYVEAVEAYRRALELHWQAPEVDAGEITKIQVNASGALQHLGQFDEAESLTRGAIERLEVRYGTDSLYVAVARTSLASTLAARGRFEQAEEEARWALTKLRELVPGHRDTAVAQLELGNALLGRGRLEDAVSEYQEALVVAVAAVGPAHTTVLNIRNNLAAALGRLGKFEEELAMHRETLRTKESSLPANHPAIAETLNNIGVNLVSQRRFADAIVAYRRTLDIFQHAFGPEHPYLDLVRSNMAMVHIELGEFDDARRLGERAWSRHGKLDAPANLRGQTGFTLARALWVTSDEAGRDRALDVAQSARAAYASLGADYATQHRKVDSWLHERDPRDRARRSK